MSQSLADLCAVELLSLYRTGRASPVEATRDVLARIRERNPELVAFCLVDEEAALAQACESEARWRPGAAQPVRALEGVPASIKDYLLTKGWPTRRGSRTVDPEQPWEEDAPVTARLREAGAVLLGKTAVPEHGCKAVTSSLLTGITRNPWNLDKTAGGSSGGAAVAVATGMGPIAAGTDAAGSIRVPASFCATVGFKPTYGRVPVYPSSPFGTVHVGPITMSVADAALTMNVISAPDDRDGTALPHPAVDFLEGLDAGIRGLRVAWSPRLGFARVLHPDVEAAVTSAVRCLEELGARVERVDPDVADSEEICFGLWAATAAALWTAMRPAQQALTDPDFAALAHCGAALSAIDIHQLNVQRNALGSRMRTFMARYDLLVTPSVAVPPFEARGPGEIVPYSREAVLGWTPFSHPFNLTLQPAISVPCGFTRDGLPVGVQLVGRLHEDACVLRAARAFEAARPWGRPPRA